MMCACVCGERGRGDAGICAAASCLKHNMICHMERIRFHQLALRNPCELDLLNTLIVRIQVQRARLLRVCRCVRCCCVHARLSSISVRVCLPGHVAHG